ncbi:MAG TPA: hypothetical protein VFR81_22540 [Longimicrobium sp.]|nr:hypothetical protein [Longimicrobium sp.]
MLGRILGVLFAAILLLPVSGAGQAARAPGAPTRVPVTVVLVERLPVPGAPFLVLRRVDAAPRDVILLPAGADARLLSEAVQTLLVARQAGGDTAAATATMRVRPQRGRTSQRPVLPWAQRVLNDLRRAEARAVEGVGSVPAVEIWLPPQSRRRAAR